MANYQHKRSAVAGKIPLASDLLDGEIAVNIKDRKLFAKDDQGVVFEFLGGNGGAVDTVNNVAPVNGNVTLNALNIPPTSDRLWLTQAERQLIASFDAYDKVESDDRYLLEANNLNDLDDASVARTNLGLGTAATRDVGENSGNVMEVGAFGLGASNGNRIPNDDADSLERTGIYSTPPTWIGSVYSGSSAGNQGTLYHSKSFSSATSYATQIFIPMINVDKMLFRKNNGTIWGAWKEVYHTSNILGTVSQSGGVPTGAIIERGSNVNGEYVRYADGTMICTVDSLTITANSNTTISFPSTFFSATRCIITGDLAAATNNYIFGSNTAQGSVSIRAVGIAGSVTLGYIAIGRWY